MQSVDIDVDLLFSRTTEMLSIPESLLQDVKDHGILVPLYVRQEGKRYKILDGELRYRVAKILALKSVPCYAMMATDIVQAGAEPKRCTPIEPAEYARLLRMAMEHYHLSEAELAEKINKTEAWVKEKLRAK